MSRSKILLISIALLTLILGNIACTNKREGEINIENVSADPYKIYIDDVFKSELAAGGLVTHRAKDGKRKLKIEQVSGFVGYPLVKTIEVKVIGGGLVTVSIP